RAGAAVGMQAREPKAPAVAFVAAAVAVAAAVVRGLADALPLPAAALGPAAAQPIAARLPQRPALLHYLQIARPHAKSAVYPPAQACGQLAQAYFPCSQPIRGL